MNPSLNMEYSSRSDIGMVRSENQDNMGKYPPDISDLQNQAGHLFIVADGMGGHAGGRLASSTAVDTIINFFSSSNEEDTEKLIRDAVSEANNSVYTKAQESENYKKMGTTCVILVIRNNTITIGHVGDSRIYLAENGRIQQLTTDHTQVQEMLNRGILTPEEAEKHPSKSILARAVGVDEKVVCDTKGGMEIRAGQTYILCTDGLAHVTREEILDITTKYNSSNACDTLIRLANERGGKDNVTVQVIKINSPDSVPVTNVKKVKKKKHFGLLLTILIIAAFSYFFKDHIEKLLLREKLTPHPPIVLPTDKVIQSSGQDQYLSLISKADNLVKRGKTEEALTIYQNILKKEPMHLSALNGINKIITILINKADILKSENNYNEALNYYYKVNELQPGRRNIIENIILCQNQLKHNPLPADSAAGDSLSIN